MVYANRGHYSIVIHIYNMWLCNIDLHVVDLFKSEYTVTEVTTYNRTNGPVVDSSTNPYYTKLYFVVIDQTLNMLLVYG